MTYSLQRRNVLSPFEDFLRSHLMPFKSCLIFPFSTFKCNTDRSARRQLPLLRAAGGGPGVAGCTFGLAHSGSIESGFSNLNIAASIVTSV